MGVLDIDFRLSDNGTYIIMRVVGEITIETATEMTGRMLEAVREHNVYRVLIDVREARNTINPRGNVVFSRQAVESDPLLMQLERVVLVAPWDRSHTVAVTALRQRGYAVAISRDETSAIRLLTGPELRSR